MQYYLPKKVICLVKHAELSLGPFSEVVEVGGRAAADIRAVHPRMLPAHTRVVFSLND